MTRYCDYSQCWHVLKFCMRETAQAMKDDPDAQDSLLSLVDLMEFMETTPITQNDMRLLVKKAFPNSADEVSTSWGPSS